VTNPFDKKPATIGNGVMVALEAGSAAQVDVLHRKALQLGGKDEGAPGPRGEGFYEFLPYGLARGATPSLQRELQVHGDSSLRISPAQLRQILQLTAQGCRGIRAFLQRSAQQSRALLGGVADDGS
jgi:hypothetical protein